MQLASWAALCPLTPSCGWRDNGYIDEHLALAASRAHGAQPHSCIQQWPSNAVGVITRDNDCTAAAEAEYQ